MLALYRHLLETQGYNIQVNLVSLKKSLLHIPRLYMLGWLTMKILIAIEFELYLKAGLWQLVF